MLRRLAVKNFKSLLDVTVEFPRLAVLFGPNAAGKSNLLEAVQTLSRLGTSRTLSDALSEPIRGYPVELFAFPTGGLPALLSQKRACFSLEADLGIGKALYRYRVGVTIQPQSGSLAVNDEYPAVLSRRGSRRATHRSNASQIRYGCGERANRRTPVKSHSV
jgi:predicted ATPase